MVISVSSRLKKGNYFSIRTGCDCAVAAQEPQSGLLKFDVVDGCCVDAASEEDLIGLGVQFLTECKFKEVHGNNTFSKCKKKS